MEEQEFENLVARFMNTIKIESEVENNERDLGASLQEIIELLKELYRFLNLYPEYEKNNFLDNMIKSLETKKVYLKTLIQIKMNELQVRNEIESLKQEVQTTKDNLNLANKTLNDIQEIKNNLFGFFGIIVGIIAFILVNFQLFSKATELEINKMVLFLSIANLSLIFGLTFILHVMSALLGQKEISYKKSIFLFPVIFSLLLIFLAIKKVF